MHINCPHRRNHIHVAAERPDEVVCPSCGSSFRVHDAPCLPALQSLILHGGCLGKMEAGRNVE
jgi:hypothetical protein